MSMLAYYHHLEPTSFYLFPVVPHFPYILNKHIANLTDFGPFGTQVPGPTGEGIWDPNSYGQFLGMSKKEEEYNTPFCNIPWLYEATEASQFPSSYNPHPYPSLTLTNHGNLPFPPIFH